MRCFFPVCFLTLCLISTGVCLAQFPGMGPKPAEAVSVEAVALRKPILTKKYVGFFDPIEKVTSLARVSGDLLSVPFKEGDIVQKGQLLYEIDDVRYQAAVKQAEAKINRVKAQIRYLSNNHERNRSLFEQNRAATEDSVENSLSMLEGAQAELLADEASLTLAQDDLFHTKISSMITGRIGRTMYTVGNYITPASGPLTTIVQLDPIYIRFLMSEKDFLSLYGTVENLRKLAKLRVKLTNDEFYPQYGEINFVDNEIDTGTDTIRIWATLPNSNYQLTPGGIATVYLSKTEEEMKPAIRLSGVLFDRGGHFVYVVEEKEGKQVVVRRSITLGANDGGFQIIEKGVTQGEVIVVDGTHKIKAGDEVAPQSYQETPALDGEGDSDIPAEQGVLPGFGGGTAPPIHLKTITAPPIASETPTPLGSGASTTLPSLSPNTTK